MTAKMGEKVFVKQVRGVIGRPQRQRDTLKALGLGRVGKTREVVLSPSIVGMLQSVRHLVSVTEL